VRFVQHVNCKLIQTEIGTVSVNIGMSDAVTTLFSVSYTSALCQLFYVPDQIYHSAQLFYCIKVARAMGDYPFGEGKGDVCKSIRMKGPVTFFATLRTHEK
jgi:hypothetical protein